MKKATIFYRIIPTAACIFLLNGCASQQDMRKVDLEMHTMDNRLIELENSINEIQKQTGTSVDSVQKRQAGLGNTVDELNTKLLQAKGELEESRHRFRSLNAELIRIKKKLDQRLARVENENIALDQKYSAKTSSLEKDIGNLDNKLADIQGGINSLETNISSLSQEIKGIKKARLEEKAARARRAAEAASAARKEATTVADSSTIHSIKPDEVKKSISNSEEKIRSNSSEQPPKKITVTTKPAKAESIDESEYEKAVSKFKAGNYREAKEIFSDLRKKYSNKSTGIKSRFMIADCLYELENYSLAILEYQQVISDHPNNDQVPHALYNQALAFEKLNDKKTAEIVYRKVINDFPKSKEASMAKKKI